jgi:hypothetical protein
MWDLLVSGIVFFLSLFFSLSLFFPVKHCASSEKFQLSPPHRRGLRCCCASPHAHQSPSTTQLLPVHGGLEELEKALGGRWIGGTGRTDHPQPNLCGSWLQWWAVVPSQLGGGGRGPGGGGFYRRRCDRSGPLWLDSTRAGRHAGQEKVGGGSGGWGRHGGGSSVTKDGGEATGGDRSDAGYFRAGGCCFPG